MKTLKAIFEESTSNKFSELNKLIIKLQLIEFFLLPILMFLLNTVVDSIVDVFISNRIYLIDELTWGFPLWFGSIISFICGVISIYLAVKGIRHSLGKKIAFNINIVIGLFGLLMLFTSTFFPQIYILFDQL